MSLSAYTANPRPGLATMYSGKLSLWHHPCPTQRGYKPNARRIYPIKNGYSSLSHQVWFWVK